MTMLFAHGFEGMGTTAEASATIQTEMQSRFPGTYSIGGGVDLVDDVDGAGRHALRWGTSAGSTSNNFRVDLKTDQKANTLFIGMRVLLSTSVTADYTLFDVFDASEASVPHIRIFVLNNTDVQIRRGTSTVIDTAVGALVPGAWRHIELKLHVDNTTGLYELRVDETLKAEGDTLDTSGGTTSIVDEVRFYGISSVSSVDYGATDDIVINNNLGLHNNSWAGDSVDDPSFPIGDALAEWSPSTPGSHFPLVDEVHPVSTVDYVGSGTASQRDLFNMGGIAGTIKAVIAEGGLIVDQQGASPVRLVAKRGANSVTSGDLVLTDAQDEVYVTHVFETDPFTGFAWTPPNWALAEMGVEKV